MILQTQRCFRDVTITKFNDDLSPESVVHGVVVKFNNNFSVIIENGNQLYSTILIRKLEYCQMNAWNVNLRSADNPVSICLRFSNAGDASSFCQILGDLKTNSEDASVFEQRTEEASASQYFQFYGYLSQQQNMMQDYIRTSTYQRAMLANLGDFKDKVVLDVGAGSGILSFFAVQAGAKKVYAVEASSMALHCESLVRHNECADRITVIGGKIEEIALPELVDTIISEPMGYMLLNERMLETFLHAKKFLKPGGKMYPSRGDLHIAPFTDEALYVEQCAKANFWCQEYFHGVNLSCLREQALIEYFRQPIVDTFDVRVCLSKTQLYQIDFGSADEQSLHHIEVPLSFILLTTALIHGLAFWFDVAFIGSNQTIWLSTAPTEPLTHWYQVRCLLQKPLMGQVGQLCTGRLLLRANKRQSYDVEIELTCGCVTSKNTLDLKNPFFRYTGQMVQPPPGHNTTSPTENYWNSVATQGAGDVLGNLSQVNLMNGMVDPTIAAAAMQQGASTFVNMYGGAQPQTINGYQAVSVARSAVPPPQTFSPRAAPNLIGNNQYNALGGDYVIPSGVVLPGNVVGGQLKM